MVDMQGSDTSLKDTEQKASQAPWDRGVRVLKQALMQIPQEPGVYRMMDHRNHILYIGKAKNLKNRVTQYTRANELPHRLQRMVSRIHDVTITTTHTEVEALLLEGHLIKTHRPEFNILFKDDKDFPWISFSDHKIPRPVMYRGRPNKTKAYGPFASSQAVYTTLEVLYRTFQLRSCSDTIFSQRKRPCLQYHIKRCSAPCVGLISEEAYRQTLHQAHQVLSGHNDEVQKELATQMTHASARMDYEKAAVLRDRIQAISAIQSFQKVHVPLLGDADVIALARQESRVCISMFLYRQGVYGGYRSYPISQDTEVSTGDILEAFLIKTYATCPVPATILVAQPIPHLDLITQALGEYRQGKTHIKHITRGLYKPMVDHAQKQAERDLWKGQGTPFWTQESWQAFQEKWSLPHLPQRIEVYDNSHIQGTSAYGGMIVASPDGFMTQAYRSFKIQNPQVQQDDYGMMREVFTRRFKNPSSGVPDPLPDAIIIDGGKGQWHAVAPLLKQWGLDIPIIAMAKGPDRNAGREFLYAGFREPFQLPPSDPVLCLMQALRDEAHRFVITCHRNSRQKRMVRSRLDQISGIGPKKRQQLLHHFGSLEAIQQAAQEDLARAPGISHALAHRLYQALHP